MKLAGKTALITGGGRGIGRAIALAFAREGADCAVAARTLAQVQEVAAEIRDLGRRAIALRCDVADRQSVDRMVDSAIKKFDHIDILVNNAGVAKSQPLTKMTDELWDEIISVNLNGTYYCTQAVIAEMIKRQSGRIINIASIAGKQGMPYISAYSASKHGVLGFTKSIAMEVAAKGITVNAICPGYVETDMATLAVNNIADKTGTTTDKAKETLLNMNPQHRLVTAEEIAAMALLLASEDGRGINGQAINICGGASQF
ncbi:MAG TPA: SDR family NAD(P)-dependent oxidoreductase [Blastocatellia bacterium]|nr:SDR family NAD(P)-dependent oxidoreductase [Blastocatellia bacterium]